MHEQGKAALRRSMDPAFTRQYFVGKGLDVGSGNDPISNYRDCYPLMLAPHTWDVEQGDGMVLGGVPDNSYDFVVSSHCLEHLCNPLVALWNWVRVVRPGGYVVVTVPDEDMYERGQWPSRHGVGHLHSFALWAHGSWSPVSIGLLKLLSGLADVASCLSCTRITEYFDPSLPPEQDQTLGPAECAIEFVLRKL